MREWVKANGGPLAVVVLGIALTAQSCYVGITMAVIGAVWYVASRRPVARRLPRVKMQRRSGAWSLEVRPPASRDKALKALRERRKHLLALLDGPAAREWDSEALRHSVEVNERDFGEDLSRHAPQYGSRWHGLPRYSTPPNTQAEFFEMRLTQAVRLLDEIIEDLERGTKP